MKNLTVNMPLAVPHQRPPSRYASHPYPVLVEEGACLVAVCPLGFILKENLMSEQVQSSVSPLSVTLKNVYIKKDVDGDKYVCDVTALDIIKVTKELTNWKYRDESPANTYSVSVASSGSIVKRRVIITTNQANKDNVFETTVEALGFSKIKG